MLLVGLLGENSNRALLQSTDELLERSTRGLAITRSFLTESKGQKLPNPPPQQSVRNVAALDHFKSRIHKTGFGNHGTKALVVRWYSR